jgi:glutamate dehydrogenase (NAD(P)+)
MRSRSDLYQNSAEGSLLLALGQVEQRDPLMPAENSVLETSESNAHFLKAACARLGYDDQVFRLLAGTSREIRVDLPILRDDGLVQTFHGYRVQHHNALGPYKGGLRFHPTVDANEVRWLACLMSLKTALIGLPLGGAKGGVDCDPKILSRRELQSLTRRYTQKLHRNIGPSLDIPAPDVGTNEQVMAWIHDEYAAIYGYTPAVVTGKPLLIGGSEGRLNATGRGVGIVMQHYAGHRADTLEGTTAIIQGFGNVGQFAALDLASRGVQIIAVSDSSAGVFQMDGLKIDGLIAHKKCTGTVAGFDGAETGRSDDLIERPCDYFIPAALGGAIDGSNVDRLNAKVIVEAANNPITPDADRVLTRNGVVVLPDILANAGGVIVSYFEWVQNLQQMPWPLEKIESELTHRLERACDQVFAVSAGQSCCYREAAYDIATRRLKDAIWTTIF